MPQRRTERARKPPPYQPPSRAHRREFLRAHPMDGVKFRGRHPMVRFADFVCLSRKIVIEIDGDHHAFQVEADARRAVVMKSPGWRVIRFTANYVLENPEGIRDGD